jgi:D-arabinose 1-dehydrogenase-like Zn-dependent alcohol dehydrogenase
MNAIATKFEKFEWLTRGLTLGSPSLEPFIRGTGKQPLNYEDRLGAIASMHTQLAKSVTALIVFEHKTKQDYDYVRQHLADLFIAQAVRDKKREPERIAMYHLAWLVSRMILDFVLEPDLEENYTAKGRLAYAGISRHQMNVDSYRKTWKGYESLMIQTIETAIFEAETAIEQYRKNTYKNMRTEGFHYSGN